MPRTARKKSEAAIYHVMLRGTDRRIIFSDDEDCERFVEILKRIREVSGFRLFAYCLMGNHVHLLMQERKEPLELIFKRIGVSYVNYYNHKYGLEGHLFQDRFRSEAIDTDAYFLDVLRYICQNPVKAGLCKSPTEYEWLRCSGLHHGDELDSFDDLSDLSGDKLLQFINESCTGEHLEYERGKRLTDREAIRVLCQACGCAYVQEIGGWEKEQKNDAIRKGIENGLSIRQLARLTGISKAQIEGALKQDRRTVPVS